MKTRINIKTIKIGLIIYIGLVLLFGLLFWLTGDIKTNDSSKTVAGFFDSIYFSIITFATIGYGDFVPTSTISKSLIFLETTSAVLFTPAFGGYLFYELFKRPKNILFPDKIYIRHINNNIVLSTRIGNQGNPTTLNVATFEFCYIRRETRWTKEQYSQDTPIFEISWFVEIFLNDAKNKKYLEALKFLYQNKDTSFIRVSLSANDIDTGQPVYFFKDYSMNEIDYGGAYISVVEYEGIKKKPAKWDNFNKIAKLNQEQIKEIETLLL
ncbi:MAG: two pore domain potassium channel family protein [Saprospiraceae bacterium]|nr:two pore domain potassium channel family protein [Saprospiraceae bacterium]